MRGNAGKGGNGMARAEQTVEERLAAIQLQRAELQLELEQEAVEALRSKRLQKEQDRARQRATIEQQERDKAWEQGNCAHKKGGTGAEEMHGGHDPLYSVIKHTMAHGAREVLCQRCQKLWVEPSAELRKSDPAAYRKQLKEWQEALRFPTDNKDSGTQLFVITRAA